MVLLKFVLPLLKTRVCLVISFSRVLKQIQLDHGGFVQTSGAFLRVYLCVKAFQDQRNKTSQSWKGDPHPHKFQESRNRGATKLDLAPGTPATKKWETSRCFKYWGFPDGTTVSEGMRGLCFFVWFHRHWILLVIVWFCCLDWFAGDSCLACVLHVFCVCF